jgi:peptidoglycan hydrolase-like protein with peptidoglycan-binding domain
MKTKFLLVSFLSLFSFGTAFAYGDCRDTINGCTIEQLVVLGESAPTTKEDRINAYKSAIEKINIKIKELTSATSPTANMDTAKLSCLDLKNNLVLGKTDSETGGEVSTLQKYLIDGGYLSTTKPTGYYGQATAKAVVSWQKAHGMDFVTTSSGVGAMTRGKMKCQAQAGVSVKWEIGAKIDETFSDALVTLGLPNGTVTTTHVSVRNDCKELNSQNLKDEYIKKVNAASVFDKQSNVLLPGLACVNRDVFAWYGVFFESGKYFIKKLNEDASGLGKETWTTVKEIETTTSQTVQKISWNITKSNAVGSPGYEYKADEQAIAIDVTFADNVTKRYKLGNAYGCTEAVGKTMQNTVKYEEKVLGKLHCYYALSSSYYAAYLQNGKFIVERGDESAKDGSITRSRILEI